MLLTVNLLIIGFSLTSFCSFSFLRWLNLLWSLLLLCLTTLGLYAGIGSAREVFQLYLTSDWVVFFGSDGVSDCFSWLVAFIMPICYLALWNNVFKPVLLLNLVSLIGIFLNCAFYCYDLLAFYFFFESTLIPMFLIIGVWGSRVEKVKASYYFFLYTLAGSLFLLVGVMYFYVTVGSTCLFYITLDVDPSYYLWLLFFIAFAVKIPIFPFHIWLPEAHVEAPTVGSVILAALLLKLGGFGYLRFMLPLFNPAVHNYYWPLVVCLSGSSIVLASLTAVRQLDMKRVIAYSSIAHMNIAVLGIFSNSVSALSGSLIIMISHGFISSAMFLLIGVLYDRYHSRLIYHYSGLASTMPIFATILIMASLGNIGFPLTYNYVGEFGVIVGLTGLNIYYGFIGSLGVFLGAVYTMWLVNRILFGNISSRYISSYHDISNRETVFLYSLIFMTVLCGVYSFIFDMIFFFDILLLIK